MPANTPGLRIKEEIDDNDFQFSDPVGRAGPGIWWQTVLVIAAWAYLCGLFWDNDGLWFQGDAPRHAINGIFWKDFLLSGSIDPRAYALSYYARYPAICPTLYPPGFYLLEALMFGLFGPSPYVGKGLVLCFALMAGLYTLAWLRRWLSPAAGGARARHRSRRPKTRATTGDEARRPAGGSTR
jgi:hypothetical protein